MPVLAILLLVLAACSAAPRQTAPAPAPGSVLARFPPGEARDVIEVAVLDRRMARAIELVAPDGATQPAYAIETERLPRLAEGAPEWGFAPASGRELPVGVSGTPTQATHAAATRTIGFVRLPNALDYARGWRSYRIRVRLGVPPGDVAVATIAAPPPPP
jgi:hypothetical protein